jgi:hypothetical protein
MSCRRPKKAKNIRRAKSTGYQKNAHSRLFMPRKIGRLMKKNGGGYKKRKGMKLAPAAKLVE